MKINYGVNKKKINKSPKRYWHSNWSTTIHVNWDWEKEHDRIHGHMMRLIRIKHPGWNLTGYALAK